MSWTSRRFRRGWSVHGQQASTRALCQPLTILKSVVCSRYLLKLSLVHGASDKLHRLRAPKSLAGEHHDV